MNVLEAAGMPRYFFDGGSARLAVEQLKAGSFICNLVQYKEAANHRF